MAILIITDNPVLNIGLRSIIVSEFPDATILESATLRDGITTGLVHSIHTLILDIGVSDGKDASVLDAFRKSSPDSAIIVHLGDKFEYIYAFIRAGVDALISKKSDPVEIAEAFQAARDKVRFVGFDIQQILLSHIASGPASRRLTRKERLIADLLLTNTSHKQIAEAARVNVNAITYYRRRIFEKLQVANLYELGHNLRRPFNPDDAPTTD